MAHPTRDARYPLRSRTINNATPDGYVPPSSDFDQRLAGATATIDALNPLLEALKPSSEFEQSVVNYMKLLTAHLRELKTDHMKLKEEFSYRNRKFVEDFDELHLNVVKNEQYSRRDTITVIGLAKQTEETPADLCGKVAQSGESVTPADLSAVHRNSKDSKSIRGKLVPPSVTVRFSKVNKKDSVLKQYRNFDTSKNAPREVKIYQSLSHHYANLRGSIVDFMKLDKSDRKYGISNNGLTLKWCTYQSPTAGFAVKLSDTTYFNKVHTWMDFVRIFQSKYPDC